MADLCLAALDAECPPTQSNGRWYRPQASVWAHAVEFFARVNGRNDFRSLIHHPRVAGGIIISKARYPAVMCASATRTPDTLTAVLYPGDEAAYHEIGLAGLSPGAAYRCEGASVPCVKADAAGHATVRVALRGRSVLHVRRRM